MPSGVSPTEGISARGMDQAGVQTLMDPGLTALDALTDRVAALELLSKLEFLGTFSSNSSGVATVTLPATGYKVSSIVPTVAGEFTNSHTISGTTLTITFLKFKRGGLGLNLGTLLSVDILSDPPGTVSFNLTVVAP